MNVSNINKIPSPELRQTVKTYSNLFVGGSASNENIVDVNYIKIAFKRKKITSTQFASVVKSCVVTNKTAVIPTGSAHYPNGYPKRASCSQAVLEPFLNLVFLNKLNTVNKAAARASKNKRSGLVSSNALKWYFLLGLGVLVASGATSVVVPKIRKRNNEQNARRGQTAYRI